jgi:hypothetical protein
VRSKAPKSILRSLGEFFGHIAHGVRTDPGKPGAAAPPPRVVRQVTEEETRETPQGKVILRRTTIEEIVVPKPGEHERGSGA